MFGFVLGVAAAGDTEDHTVDEILTDHHLFVNKHIAIGSLKRFAAGQTDIKQFVSQRIAQFTDELGQVFAPQFPPADKFFGVGSIFRSFVIEPGIFGDIDAVKFLLSLLSSANLMAFLAVAILFVLHRYTACSGISSTTLEFNFSNTVGISSSSFVRSTFKILINSESVWRMICFK